MVLDAQIRYRLRDQLGRYRTIREVIGRYRKIEEDNGTLFESKIQRVQVRYSRPDQLGRYRTIREVTGSYGKISEHYLIYNTPQVQVRCSGSDRFVFGSNLWENKGG